MAKYRWEIKARLTVNLDDFFHSFIYKIIDEGKKIERDKFISSRLPSGIRIQLFGHKNLTPGRAIDFSLEIRNDGIKRLSIYTISKDGLRLPKTEIVKQVISFVNLNPSKYKYKPQEVLVWV